MSRFHKGRLFITDGRFASSTSKFSHISLLYVCLARSTFIDLITTNDLDVILTFCVLFILLKKTHKNIFKRKCLLVCSKCHCCHAEDSICHFNGITLQKTQG